MVVLLMITKKQLKKLKKMVKDESPYIREMAALDPELPENLMLILTKDTCHNISLALLKNPNVTEKVLYALLNKTVSGYVQHRVAIFMLQRYTNNQMFIDDVSLCDVVRNVHAYQPFSNLDLLQYIELLQAEREHNLWVKKL
jgi:hypothetical protein